MKARFSTLFLFFILLATSITVAQAQDDDDDDGEYHREFVWGINKNTNGGYIGGLNIKFSRQVAPNTYRSFGFEMANVKHPKESRFPSFSGGTFIRAKINYLYALRFSVGMEKVLFKKGPQQGVQINVLASAGPSIGIIAPYYVEYANNSGNYPYTVPYTPDLNIFYIYGPARPLQGIEESSIAPGLHLRTGVSFEFGTFKSSVSGLEIGLMLEGYTQRVKLLALTEGQWLYPSAYITLFHGNRR
jgi:hypothetical protein